MVKKNLKCNDPNFEKGFEDIHSDKPYLDWDVDGKRVLLHMLYIPRTQRRNGVGKYLFQQLISELPEDIEYIRLKSACLGSGDTITFWKSLGFKSAYECTCEDNLRILHLAVNGFELPVVEIITDCEERHYIFD